MLTFDVPLWILLQTIAAVGLPLLVGLITRTSTSADTKAILLVAFNIIAALITQIADALQAGKTYNLGTALLAAIASFAISVGTHYGIWKKTGVTAAVQAVGSAPRHSA